MGGWTSEQRRKLSRNDKLLFLDGTENPRIHLWTKPIQKLNTLILPLGSGTTSINPLPTNNPPITNYKPTNTH